MGHPPFVMPCGYAPQAGPLTGTGSGAPIRGIPRETAGLPAGCSCAAAHASPPFVRRTE